MIASTTSDLIEAVALLIMAITGGVFLVLAIWKGRGFVAQYKDWKVTLNPQTLREFSTKMDEVVKSVNNKAPSEPTLFQTVRNHTTQLQQLNISVNQIKASSARTEKMVNLLIDDLKQQVGLRVTAPTTPKEEPHGQDQGHP